mgnify:CR=1 FL=1
MPPVSPGQPSSYGSVFADAPGLLRENGFAQTFTCAPTTNGIDIPICSSTAGADVTAFQPVLAPLGPGDSLNIYGIQAAHAGGTTPLTFALRVGSHDETNDPTLMVGTSNRNGPWFQHFELPLQIEGPASGTKEVWLEIMDWGSAPRSYNRITLECVVVRKAG